jgi:hypothetical protein
MTKKGGRPKKNDEAKNKRIAIALDEKEYRTILEKCETSGLKPSIFCRGIILNGYVKQRISGEYLKLLKQADGIANNLNQTVKIMNTLMKDNQISSLQNHIIKLMDTIKIFDTFQKNSENDN